MLTNIGSILKLIIMKKLSKNWSLKSKDSGIKTSLILSNYSVVDISYTATISSNLL